MVKRFFKSLTTPKASIERLNNRNFGKWYRTAEVQNAIATGRGVSSFGLDALAAYDSWLKSKTHTRPLQVRRRKTTRRYKRKTYRKRGSKGSPEVQILRIAKSATNRIIKAEEKHQAKGILPSILTTLGAADPRIKAAADALTVATNHVKSEEGRKQSAINAGGSFIKKELSGHSKGLVSFAKRFAKVV